MRHARGISFGGDLIQAGSRFIGHDHQAMTALTAEPMNQATRIFMGQAAGLATAIAEY